MEKKKYSGDILKFQSRKWRITINNPNENMCDVLPFEAWTEDAEQDKMNWKMWIEETIRPDYYALSFEYGLEENHTPHIHIYITKKAPWKGQTLINKFGNKVHLDLCDSTSLANRNYVFKESLSEENIHKIAERIEGRQLEGGEMPLEKYNVTSKVVVKKKEDIYSAAKRLIDSGMTPTQILNANPSFYKIKKDIKEMFIDKRTEEMGNKKTEMEVTFHCGVSGSGKTYEVMKVPQDELFIATDYTNSGYCLFDKYEAQSTILLDEFRGQIPYYYLLEILGEYNVKAHARYDAVRCLWTNVHITSVKPIETWYSNLWEEDEYDTYTQLLRRITKVVYHYITDSNNVLIPDRMKFLAEHNKNEIKYHSYEIDMTHYTSYSDLEEEALRANNVLLPYDGEFDYTDTLETEFREWKEKKFFIETYDKSEEELFAEFWACKSKCSGDTSVA